MTGENAVESTLITLGVFLGSSAWWVVLTSVVGRLRTRVTARWLRVINIVSGVVLAVFATAAIVLAVRGPA